MSDQERAARFKKLLATLAQDDPALRAEIIEFIYRGFILRLSVENLTQLSGTIEEMVLDYLAGVESSRLTFPKEVAPNVPTLDNLIQLEEAAASEDVQGKVATRRVESATIKALIEQQKKTAIPEPKVVEKPPTVEVGLKQPAAEEVLPIYKISLRPRTSPVSPPPSPPPLAATSDTAALFIRLQGKPLPWWQRVFAQMGFVDFSAENLGVFQAATAGLAKTGYDERTIGLLQNNLSWLARRSGQVSTAEFITAGKLAGIKSGKLFRLAFDFEAGKVSFLPQAWPGLAGRFSLASVGQNLSSRFGLLLHGFFTNPRLSWLRLSFSGALGLGSLALPLPFPARIALAGAGGISALPDLLRNGGRLLGPLSRGAARTVLFFLNAPQLMGITAGVLIIIIVGVPTALWFLTLQRDEVVSTALLQGGPGVPIEELPPDFVPPKPINVPGLTFSWPVLGAFPQCTSPYGYRADPFSGKTSFHAGIDIRAPQGTPVFPVAEGLVYKMGNDVIYGNFVVVKHAANFFSLYGHLISFAARLRVGTTVTTSTLLGLADNTGYSEKSHLHLSVSNSGGEVSDFKANSATNPCFYLASFCAQSSKSCVNLTR